MFYHIPVLPYLFSNVSLVYDREYCYKNKINSKNVNF